MAVKIDDVERLRRLLSADQLRNAVVFERVFMPRGKTVVFADNESNAGAVAAVEMPEHEGDNYSMAMQGTTPDAARDVLRAVPDGGYWIHLADEDLFPVLTERMRMGWYDRAWLLVMDPNEMRSEVRHQTQKIDVKWAHRIAAVWAADWDAGGYVKSRLEKGPSSGVLVEGDLVGWGLTHFETEAVSMLGFMFILPEFRNKGFAESITADLVRQVAVSGRVPACHVYEENYQSLGLCEGMGFRRVCKQVWGDAVTRR